MIVAFQGCMIVALQGCVSVALQGCVIFALQGGVIVALQGCVIVALQGCVSVALQGCVIFALQGCIFVVLQGCVIVALQGCVIVVLLGCVIVVLQGCIIVYSYLIPPYQMWPRDSARIQPTTKPPAGYTVSRFGSRSSRCAFEVQLPPEALNMSPLHKRGELQSIKYLDQIKYLKVFESVRFFLGQGAKSAQILIFSTFLSIVSEYVRPSAAADFAC
jgi:hypothetical protein